MTITARGDEANLVTCQPDRFIAAGIGPVCCHLKCHKALRRATAHPWVRGAEWLMCLDVDEFINLREGVQNLKRRVLGPLSTPTLFGGLARRGGQPGRRRKRRERRTALRSR